MSDNPGIRLLKNIFRKFKAFLFSKDALIFLFFLLLSFAFWFAHALNKNREANITIPIRYTELPKDIVISNNPPQEIKLNVRDEGMNLFAYSKKRILPLSIDIPASNIKNGYIKLSTDQILNRLSHHLRPTTTILGFSPDSIYLEFEKLYSRSLPVKLNADIELAQQYILSDSIHITPNRVTAYGSKLALDTLKEVMTEKIHLQKMKDSVSLKVKLIPIEFVNFSTDEVDVTIPVEMFTEKRIQLPVTFINVPAGLTIRSFPALINVSYNVGLSQYNTVINDMQIIVDYHDIQKNDQEKQKLKILNNSSKIFNVRISPEEIEFILEESNE